MSAYDKDFSDAIYGVEDDGRYVTESRLKKMLNHEVELIEKRFISIMVGFAGQRDMHVDDMGLLENFVQCRFFYITIAIVMFVFIMRQHRDIKWRQ